MNFASWELFNALYVSSCPSLAEAVGLQLWSSGNSFESEVSPCESVSSGGQGMGSEMNIQTSKLADDAGQFEMMIECGKNMKIGKVATSRSYILKVKKMAESTFQPEQIGGKSV